MVSVHHGRCEISRSRQRISTALAKTRTKDRRRMHVRGTCAHARMWRYMVQLPHRVVTQLTLSIVTSNLDDSTKLAYSTLIMQQDFLFTQTL
jgi:hypothetical protein